MTDSKENEYKSESNKEGNCSRKKSRPRFSSQLSNVSFSSIAGGYSGNRSNGGASPVAHLPNPMSLPRMSIRSILMNSPFSKRTKLRRGCHVSKTSKTSVDAESGRCSTAFSDKSEPGSASKPTSSLKRNSSSTCGDSSLRRSSSGSKVQALSQTDSYKWGVGSEQGAFASPPTASNDSLADSLKKDSISKSPGRVSTSSGSNKLKECSLCLQVLEPNKFLELLTCNHSSCLSCMKQYLIVEITESRINITCPQCQQLMHPTDIHQILNNSILSYKYEDFMIRRVLAMDPDTRWCPAPDCGYALIASGCASCPKLKCERPGCGSYFCYHCKAEWHPNQTCDMARAQRFPNVPFSSLSHLHDIQNNDDVKSCPRCQVLIVKMDDGSCNHMTCSVCSAEFCWLCMKEISDLHYLSPSGCTFWGKKPWSRKKIIMWQLGTLVGAPVGIALLAGLAVPAMIIGIPIWVGRKLHSRCSGKGKHKRNLAVVGGVTASAVLSPLLAGLAVSIGIPILLAYVYGVVPISLCRSGGCGVTTSATGVRFAFDDENDVVIGIPGRQSGEANPSLGANPSIGEVSCGASLSAESAAHLLGESDRESASNTAIAPASLTGSIASSCLSRSHRVELRGADIIHGNRSVASVDTQSSAASTHTIDMENASTKALAGSLLQYKLTESEGEYENGSLSGRLSRNYEGGDSVSGVVDVGGGVSSSHLSHHHHHVNFSGADTVSTDAVSTDACSMHSGIDMNRLDSVSAIIKAKGVTFTDTDYEIVGDTKTSYSASSANNSVFLEMGGDGEEDEDNTSIEPLKPESREEVLQQRYHDDRGFQSVRPKQRNNNFTLRRTSSVVSDVTRAQFAEMELGRSVPARSKSHPKLSDF